MSACSAFGSSRTRRSAISWKSALSCSPTPTSVRARTALRSTRSISSISSSSDHRVMGRSRSATVGAQNARFSSVAASKSPASSSRSSSSAYVTTSSDHSWSGSGASNSTRSVTSSGCRAAKSRQTKPPYDAPTSATRSPATVSARSSCRGWRRSSPGSSNPSHIPGSATPAWTSTVLRLIQLQHGEERLLRHFDAPDLLHPLLAFLLLLEELPLARHVAPVALGDHVLPHRLHRLAGDYLRPDRGLDSHLELLARDLLAEALSEYAAGRIGLVAVHDHRERVDLVTCEQDVQLHEVALAHADQLVVERRITARSRLQLVEEVEHDLGKRKVVVELHALLRQERHVHVSAAPLLAKLHHRPDVLLRHQDRGPDVGLLDRGDLDAVRHVGRRVNDHLAAVGEPDVVLDVRGRGQQLEVVLALEALAHDVHVEQPEEAAAETEAERLAGLGLPRERGVVQRQLLERVAQLRELVRLHREQPAEDHRLDLPVAGERLARRALLRGERVADAQVRDVLDPRDHVADLAGAQRVHRRHLRAEETDLVDLGPGARLHGDNGVVLAERAVDHADVGDHAAVLVELRV